jgi:hypothetical protein
MADLLLNPSTLTALANSQEAAAKHAEAAANDLNGTASDCRITHGAIGCPLAAGGLDSIEEIRRVAGQALADGSKHLAAKLRAAREAYQGVDGELAGNLNKQMLDR